MQRVVNVLIACLIFIIGLLLLSAFSTRGFYPSEAGLALFAKAMGQHGGPWVSRAYLPLVDINFSSVPSLMYLSARHWGQFNVFSMAFPGMIASSIAIAFTYLLGAVQSRQWGFLAALLMLTTEAFFMSSRSLSVFPYMTAITAATLFFMVEFELQSICFYPLLAILFCLAFLVNGLLGVLVPALAVCFYLLFRGKIKQCGVMAGLAIAVGLVGCIALISAASSEGGSPLVEHVIHGQLHSLLPTMKWHWAANNLFSLLFYAISLPLAILVVVLRWHELLLPNAKWEMQLLRALLMWSAFIIFFSVFWGKQADFMLPMVPALALVGATLFTKPSDGFFLVSTRKVLLRLFFLAPFLALLVLLVLFSKNYAHHAEAVPFFTSSFILLLLAAVLTLFFGLNKKMQLQARARAIILLAAAAFFIVNIGVIEPAAGGHDKSSQLAKKVNVLEQSHKKPLVFYRIGPGKQDMWLMFYLNQGIKPLFIQNMAAYGDQGEVYVVMQANDYRALSNLLREQTKVLAQGELQGLPVIVFEKMLENPANKAAPQKAANKNAAHHLGAS